MISECVLVVERMLLNCIQLRFVQKTAWGMTWRVRYASLMWGVLLVLLRREAHCTSLYASSAGSQAPNLDCPAAKMAAGEQLRTPRCNARGARTVQLIPCKDGPQLWTMTMTMVWSQATPSYIMLDEKKGMIGGIGSNVIHYFVRSSFGSLGPCVPSPPSHASGFWFDLNDQ